MGVQAQAQISIRIISHNVRYATTSPFKGEKLWVDRRQLIVNQLRYNSLYNLESFICLQEVLHHQLLDVAQGLGPEWGSIGVGRDDGKEKGEYSPIFYRPSIWKVESWRTVWLSETPDKPGKGWDAASVRIVTVGVFQHRASGGRVIGMSTHLDDQGEKSRTESAKLILRVVEETSKGGNNSHTAVLVFLAGDLNSEMSGSAYRILNGKESPLQDVKELAIWKHGDRNTFTGFQDSTKKQEIDHIFLGPRGSTGVWKVEGSTVLPNRFEDGVYCSDHRAVVGDTVWTV